MNVTLGNSSTSPEDYIRPTLKTTVASVNLALGLPINSYVLWLILSGAGGAIASQFFSLNLIVSGIISLLASVFYFAWILANAAIFQILRNVAVHCFIFSAPLFQCCICVERFIAVAHPVVFLRYKPLLYRVACCCVAWLIMIVTVGFGHIFRFHTALICIFLASYIVYISVMSFCCVSVLRALKQPGPGEGQRDSQEGKDLKRRAFKIILIILITMLVSYVPYVFTVGLQFCVKCVSLLGHFPLAIDIAYSVFTMSGLVHPILVMHRGGKLPCFKMLKAG